VFHKAALELYSCMHRGSGHDDEKVWQTGNGMRLLASEKRLVFKNEAT